MSETLERNNNEEAIKEVLTIVKEENDKLKEMINNPGEGGVAGNVDISGITTKLDEVIEKLESHDERFDHIDAMLNKVFREIEDMSIDVSTLEEPEDFDYSLDRDNRTITLTHYHGPLTDITVQDRYAIEGKSYNTQIGGTTGLFSNNTSITKVTFEDRIKFLSCENLFKGCTSLETIRWSQDENHILDMSECISMAHMFHNCKALKVIESSLFNTDEVTDMSYMFYGCNGVTSLDVTKFNTSNVEDMSYMFYGCGVTSLNLVNFNTDKVTNMSYMFYSCNISSIEFPDNFGSACTDMNHMFSLATQLKVIDVTKFNTSNVEDMSYMFGKNSIVTTDNTTTIDISSFDTSKVKNMNSMFGYMNKLTSIKFPEIFGTACTNMSSMFSYCTDITSLDLSSFDTSNVIDMSNMFTYCQKLTDITVGDTFVASNVTDMSYMFSGCTVLTNKSVNGVVAAFNNTLSIKTMANMFKACTALTNITLYTFDVVIGVNTDYMFKDCSKLTKISVKRDRWTKALSSVSNTFEGCGTTELTKVS